MKTQKKNQAYFALAGAALAALGAGTSLFALPGCRPSTPTTTVTATTDPPIVSPPPRTGDLGEPGEPGKPRKVVVYEVATNADGDQRLESREIALTGDRVKTPATAALESMTGSATSPLPKGTKVLSLNIDNGLATVDFSREFRDNFEGGDTQEALVINAVLATLGQFETVREVQILVEGQKIDSLGGNKELTAPLPVPQTVGENGSPDGDGSA